MFFTRTNRNLRKEGNIVIVNKQLIVFYVHVSPLLSNLVLRFLQNHGFKHLSLKGGMSPAGGRDQLQLFAIGLLVRMMRAIVTSLPVKPGKFEWVIKYKLTNYDQFDQSNYSTPSHQIIKPT